MFDKQVINLLKKHNLTSRILLAPRDSDLTLIYPNQIIQIIQIIQISLSHF